MEKTELVGMMYKIAFALVFFFLPLSLNAQVSNSGYDSEGGNECTNAVPTGMVMAFAGRGVPEGWLPCDGRAVPLSKFKALHEVLGDVYGIGAEPDTFKLPDLRGRTLVGQDTEVDGKFAERITAPWSRVLGGAGGEEKHTLTIDELPAHYHHLPMGTVPFEYRKGVNGMKSYYDYSGEKKSFSVDPEQVKREPKKFKLGDRSQTVGAGMPHNIMQPSMVMKWVIKY